MVDDIYNIKLIDFGEAKVIDKYDDQMNLDNQVSSVKGGNMTRPN